MILQQPILFITQSLPHFNQKHLNLQQYPTQSITKKLPHQTIQTPHNYITHNITTLLKTLLLYPKTNKTFKTLTPNIYKTNLNKLKFNKTHNIKINTKTKHTLIKITNKITPNK